MKANRLVVGFAVAIVFQLSVLVGMVGISALPLVIGTEIKLATEPIDPRSLFRGNYARLGYDISRIDSSFFPEAELRQGEVVYISLEMNEDGVHEPIAASLQAPSGGVFIRGRVANRGVRTNANDSVQVLYGIEAFFAPPEEAIALETELRSDGAIALVMVSESGSARLKAIHPDERSE